MESIYTELALSGSQNKCARTDNVFFPISEVCNCMVSLMNHLLGPMQETSLVESQGKGKENKGNKHAKQKCFHGSKNIQMAAMDGPLFNHALFYFLLNLHVVEETFFAQKKCAYYQSGTPFLIKTLSSTNV